MTSQLGVKIEYFDPHACINRRTTADILSMNWTDQYCYGWKRNGLRTYRVKQEVDLTKLHPNDSSEDELETDSEEDVEAPRNAEPQESGYCPVDDDEVLDRARDERREIDIEGENVGETDDLGNPIVPEDLGTNNSGPLSPTIEGFPTGGLPPLAKPSNLNNPPVTVLPPALPNKA